MSIVIKNLTHIYNEGMPFASTALDNISIEIKDRIEILLTDLTPMFKIYIIYNLLLFIAYKDLTE